MYSPDDLQPINRNYIIFGLIFVTIFSFIIYKIVVPNETVIKPITSTQPGNNTITNGNSPSVLKYDEDSDGDKIPNFMEEILGTNIYSSEVAECEKNTFTCKESPLSDTFNINILLDASTSMNIIGGKEAKINEVRNAVKQSLASELSSPYYKISIYSFGNRGIQGNIPDNESCVAVLRHKNLNTPLSDPRIQDKDFLSNYLPNGKSPLNYSLNEISKILNKNEKNLVIIITDGLDDCNGDVKRIITEMKNSGVASKISLATYYANEDANIYLKEAVESNGGDFLQNPDLGKFINDSSRNFIKLNWCKNDEVRKFKNCIDTKYKTANSYLNDQKNNRNLSEDEKVKIANTQSVMSYYLEQNLRKYQTSMDEDFNNYFKKKD